MACAQPLLTTIIRSCLHHLHTQLVPLLSEASKIIGEQISAPLNLTLAYGGIGCRALCTRTAPSVACGPQIFHLKMRIIHQLVSDESNFNYLDQTLRHLSLSGHYARRQACSQAPIGDEQVERIKIINSAGAETNYVQ